MKTAYNPEPFPLEEEYPQVLISYAKKTGSNHQSNNDNNKSNNNHHSNNDNNKSNGNHQSNGNNNQRSLRKADELYESEKHVWALANVLRESGVASFHGLHIPASYNWRKEWFSRIEDAVIGIVMLSNEYFESSSSVEELEHMLNNKLAVIPLIFGKYNIQGNFLGNSPNDVRLSKYIRCMLNVNTVPRPRQGLFQDNFGRNASTLVSIIRMRLCSGSRNK